VLAKSGHELGNQRRSHEVEVHPDAELAQLLSQVGVFVPQSHRFSGIDLLEGREHVPLLRRHVSKEKILQTSPGVSETVAVACLGRPFGLLERFLQELVVGD
jgi:hypothetical protein